MRIKGINLWSPHFGSAFAHSMHYDSPDSQGNVCTRVDKISCIPPFGPRQNAPPIAKGPKHLPNAPRLKKNMSGQGGSLKIATQDNRQETKCRQPCHSTTKTLYEACGKSQSAANSTKSQDTSESAYVNKQSKV